MTDPFHAEPIRDWRTCHGCAKVLLKQLANGVLVLDEHARLSIHPVRYVRQARKRVVKIVCEIMKDDRHGGAADV